MKKHILARTLSIIVIASLLVVLVPFAQLHATASGSLSVSGSREVGSTLTVSIRVSGSDDLYYGFSGGLAYDSEFLRLDSITKGSFSADYFVASEGTGRFAAGTAEIPSGTTIINATFTCLKAGSTTVSLSDFEVDGKYSSSSTSITITTPVVRSSNANLSSLRVSPGSLSPSFSASTTWYSMFVDEEVTQITVSATAADSNARVAINGVQNNLVMGENSVRITVTAEDGSTRVYTINVQRGPLPEPLPLMIYMDVEYVIVRFDNNTTIPEGFTEGTAMYKDVEIPVLIGQISESETIMLVLLMTDDGDRFFIYDEETETVYPYMYFELNQMSLLILKATEATLIPVGYEPFDFDYYGEIITAYRLIDNPDHGQILLYLFAGEEGGQFFYYDLETGMIMPYRGDLILLQVTPDPTPTPEATPTTEPIVVEELPEEAPDRPSLGAQLTDLKNPLTILFYIICFVAFLLIALLVVMIVLKKLSDEDKYIAAEEIDKDYYSDKNDGNDASQKSADEADVPFLMLDPEAQREEDDSVDRARRFESPMSTDPIDIDIPAIARVDRVPPKANAQSSGVRAVSLDSVPELSEQFSEDKLVNNKTDDIASPSAKPVEHEKPAENSPHIPVRLRRDLEQERATTPVQPKTDAAQENTDVKRDSSATSSMPDNQSNSKEKNSHTRQQSSLDFPDISRSNGKASNSVDHTDPDIE